MRELSYLCDRRGKLPALPSEDDLFDECPNRQRRRRELLAGLDVLIMPLLQAKDLHYVARAAACDALVLADEEKVRQILLNLLSNAIKFTSVGGSIEIACHEQPERVEISVTDSGIGIPAEKLAAIFEPFVQVERHLASTHEGTGLGLSISRNLARAMGGDLIVESGLGHGARFTLTLPRAGEDGK